MAQPSSSWAPPAQQEISSTTSQHRQEVSSNGTHRQRIYFWVAAGFAWAVWALAVTAAGHDKWLRTRSEDDDVRFGAGNDSLLYFCEENIFNDEFDHFCDLYRGFSATQFAATVTCSIAVALLALAAFRPAVAGCASAKSLAIAGGVLMIVYAMVQLGAAMLAYFVERELEHIFDDFLRVELQLTFWVGVAGLVLALFTSMCLLAKVKHAGEGPLYGVGRLWIASGFAWVVWALAVTAAAHDEWLLLQVGDVPVLDAGVGPGGLDALENCEIFDEVEYDDATNDFKLLCDYYRGFSAMQFAATATCSIAVALLALAAFRPAVARCASVKPLAIAGGVLLIVYAMVQLGAAVLAHFLAKEWERIYNGFFRDDDPTFQFELEFGPTFWMGVVGLVLAVIVACGLFASPKDAEDGPFHGGTCGVKDRDNATHGNA